MPFVVGLIFAIASSQAFAGSAFETTDVTKLRADRERAIQDIRDKGLARLYDANSKMVKSISTFANEHGGLAAEPTCDSQNWRCTNGPCVPTVPEPWNPYQALSTINLNSLMAIMNCNVVTKDGWHCVQNWSPSRDGLSAGLYFHCKRDGYEKDFLVKGTKKAL